MSKPKIVKSAVAGTVLEVDGNGDPAVVKPDVPLWDGMNIHERVCAMREDMGSLTADKRAAIGNYKYRGHLAVTTVCKPFFEKWGISYVPSCQESKTTPFTYLAKSGVEKTEFYTEVVAVLTFWCKDDPKAEHGSTLQSYWPGLGTDSRDLGPGKAVSYAIKTGLLKTFMLDRMDDCKDNEDAKDAGGDWDF